MVLKFSLDPQTGVVVPPVTVFNGGKRKKTRKSKSKRKGRKASRKARQTRRR